MVITGNGPNDATVLFGPFSQFFFSFFLIFLLLTGITFVIQGWKGSWGWQQRKWAQMMHKASFGPLVSFFFFFLILLLLTITIRYYVCYKGTKSVMGASGDENESRRCFVRHLGYQFNFFFPFFFVLFSSLNKCIVK